MNKNKENINSFPGGIHPTDGLDKELSQRFAIQTMIPDQIAISMEPSPGAICELVVKEGDFVERGDLIAKAASFLAVNQHTGISGVVSKISKEKNLLGKEITVCHIRQDKKQDKKQDAPKHMEEYTLEQGLQMPRENLVDCIKEGGLAGMGGAGFPTYIKYESKKEIHTLLINGAECEPYLTCDYRLMKEEPLAILMGAILLQRAAAADRTIICIEENKEDGAEALRSALLELKKAEPKLEQLHSLEVKVLPVKYPQGGERQLIQTVLGREIPMGGLPADVGVIVSNLATAKSAADMILKHEPLMQRVVTVTGKVNHPGNFQVPIGTPLEVILKAAGGVSVEENRIILGGPMTGTCILENYDGTQTLPSVTKSTSGIVVLEATQREESPCIRCGACAIACPAGLNPFQIDAAVLQEDYELCEQLYASECIACGCCSYVCPARRELAVRTKQARDTIKQRKSNKNKNKIRIVQGPHLRTHRTTQSIMRDVMIALLPAALGSIYFFGMRSLLLMMVAIFTCVFSEYLWQKGSKHKITIGDYSTVVTGMLLAFNVPVTVPVWVIVVASIFAIIVVKQMFGGIGNNFANPALMGRLLVMLAWPSQMMQYVIPRTLEVDAISAATVLSSAKSGVTAGYSYLQMFLGEIPGALGETSKLLLLIGFVYLCYKGVVNVRVSLSYLLTVIVVTFVLGPQGLFTGDPLLNLFGGGLMLGAFYMLTDYGFVSKRGKLLFGVVAGVITALIRIYSPYPEGVFYGILIANCLSGWMASFYKQKVYGVKIEN